MVLLWESVLGTSGLCSWSLVVLPIHHPLSQVIAKFMDVKYHFYVDDSQLFIHLSPGNCVKSLHQLKVCLNDTHTWMFENKLKLNL